MYYILIEIRKEEGKKTFLPILSTENKWKGFEIGIDDKSFNGLKDDKFICIELTQFQDRMSNGND